MKELSFLVNQSGLLLPDFLSAFSLKSLFSMSAEMIGPLKTSRGGRDGEDCLMFLFDFGTQVVCLSKHPSIHPSIHPPVYP